MDGHQLDARCACGYRWTYYVGDDIDPDDEMPECAVCGDTVRDLGPHHSAGRDVKP